SDTEEIRLDEREVAAEKVKEELEREAQRMNAQIVRDEEIAKIHVEEESQRMIEGLDRSNETIAKHLEEYEQAVAKLTIGERIELISKIKRKGLNLEQESAKKQKTSKEVPEEVKSFDEVPEEKIKEWIQLVMETIWAMWDAFLTENPNATSGYSSDLGKSEVCIGEYLTRVEGVAAFFGVPLKMQVDYENFAKDIKRGTYEVWLKLTRLQHKAILKTAQDGWNALLELESVGLGASVITVPSVVSPCKPIVKTIDTDENSDHIVQSVDINTMPTSMLELLKQLGKHGLKRIMMNSKGFFFFKFDSQSGLEAVLEGGPWLIRKALIILKKWSTDTKMLKEELTRIPIWVKLHDVPL
nr:zinc knuckle CX2CX4HX4C [Tanacetum cinerariifolium]